MPLSLNTFLQKSSASVPFLVHDYDVRGGFKIFSTIAERDASHFGSRKQGMVCYVIADTTYYTLATSNLNAWSVWSPGGGSGGAPVDHDHDASDIVSGTLDSARLPQVSTQPGVTISAAAPLPTDGQDGDIWFQIP